MAKTKVKTPSSSTLKDWEKRASKELKGKATSSIHWKTSEGIEIKPLYTADDLEKLGYTETLSGFSPFTRGIRSTMYAGRPWTIRQYAGFRLQKNQTLFIVKIWLQAKRGSVLPLIWRLTEDMIPIIHESLEMLVKQEWLLIQ